MLFTMCTIPCSCFWWCPESSCFVISTFQKLLAANGTCAAGLRLDGLALRSEGKNWAVPARNCDWPLASAIFPIPIPIWTPTGALQFNLCVYNLQHCSAKLCQSPTNAASQNLTPQTLPWNPQVQFLNPASNHKLALISSDSSAPVVWISALEYLQQDNLRKFFNSIPKKTTPVGQWKCTFRCRQNSGATSNLQPSIAVALSTEIDLGPNMTLLPKFGSSRVIGEQSFKSSKTFTGPQWFCLEK